MPDAVTSQTLVGVAIKVALGLGLGTLLLRIGSAELRQHVVLPSRVHEAMEWLPVAALAAMVAPALAPTGPAPWDTTVLAAAALSAWVGHRSRNMLLGVGSGLGIFWLLGWLLG